MRNAIAIVLALAETAHAEHDHHAHEAQAEQPQFTATVGVIAARYRSRLYEGDYQGATAGLAWRRGRVELAASGAAYQIERNGRTYRGFGDAAVHGSVAIVERERAAAGAHLMVMLPAGAEMKGLGMGHFMVMPAAWASWSPGDLELGASVGYARGLGDAGVHAAHGGGAAWPLVEPMSFSQITFEGSAMYAVADGLRAGGRVLGAVPLEDDARVIAGARVAWRAGRVETTAEAQTGLAGDPFRVRGLVSTALRF